ncbi:MAG TPA: hypothetical protein VFM58_12675 [Solirubrobacteraceae bacterium]|nr:hypothetical protein [Solirubrobacteraceae bacterium]
MRHRVLLAATVAASLIPAAPAFAGDPIMPLAQVRAGMHCTGYSVVRGTAISSFDVDVVDVVDSEPGTDGARILVTVSGPAVDATGIGPGFSGSPIYCPDGSGVQRNIGAISESIGDYGGKTVLATPIEIMLANSADPPKPPNAQASRSRRARAAIRRMRTQGVKPLATPLTISGVSPRLGRALEETGRKIGRPVIAVPAGPLGSFPVQTLRPGSAVSAGYSSGDLRVGAIGTVAYTDAGRVWAFGHNFESAGARSLLLQDAYVFKVVNEPNAAITGGSYKLAAAGHDVGTLTNDAFAAIVGRLGALPQTTDVGIAAVDHDTGDTRFVQTTVADETDVDTPTGFTALGAVAPLAVAEAAGSVMRSSPGRLTGTMCLRITFRERPKHAARFCNRYLSSTILEPDAGPLGNAVAFSAALDTLDAITLIEAYEGRTPHVAKVGANIDMRRGEQLAFLRKVKAPKRVRPGQRVRLRVTMQRVRDGNLKRTYRVRIPRRVKPGRRKLKLIGFKQSSPDEALLELLLGDESGDEPSNGPARLSDLIDGIESLGRWDGVRIGIKGHKKRAFKDGDLVITGRAQTRVRVVRR